MSPPPPALTTEGSVGSRQSQGGIGPWYTLGVLLVAYVLAFIDRQILSLLVEPMKAALRLNDTQISLLQGFAFAAFLALTGLPLGWLIDRTGRVRMITAGVSVWSLFTGLCAFVPGYLPLLLCRMGVGIGEATVTPAAHALIADRFPRQRLGLALGVFGMGSYAGAGVALLLGSALLTILPSAQMSFLGHPLPSWRAVFLMLALAGLPVAVWVSTLREPARAAAYTRTELREVMAYFRTHAASIAAVNFSGTFSGMAAYASAAWMPSCLIRTFGWTASQAGQAYGVILLVCGVAGTLLGGVCGDWVTSRGRTDGRPLVMAWSSLGAAALTAPALLAHSPALSLGLLAPVTLLLVVSLSTLPAAQQAMMPPGMRAVAAALGVFMVNMIGLGAGPTLIAVTTDYVLHDPAKLRLSLAMLLPLMLLVSAACAFAALRPYRDSITRLPAHRGSQPD